MNREEKLKVLVVGSGGREHALVWKLKQSPSVTRIFCAPGNGGISTDGDCVPIAADDVDGLAAFAAQEQVHLTVVGPELPLTLGIVDRFEGRGLQVVGPSRRASALEGSKVFAKQFMARHGIPTARFEAFDSYERARRALESRDWQPPLVLKADGLAGGKGVLIPQTRQEAIDALDAVMKERRFGAAGDRVLFEEWLEGEEASCIVLTDGRAICPLAPAQDYKRVFDGDRGPNTGGMGAFSFGGLLGPSLEQTILETIVRPTVEGMRQDGAPYRGFLYAGLMLTSDGPKVLEFNARMGDPECQVILPRLRSDLLELLQATVKGALEEQDAEWSPEAAVTVVLASAGYPDRYETGKPIRGLERIGNGRRAIFHAGTGCTNDGFVTAGGRVLDVTAWSATLQEAIREAYGAAEQIEFEGKHYRRDIGQKGLKKTRSSKEHHADPKAGPPVKRS